MYYPLSFVHEAFALLRIPLCRVGGDRGGVRVSVRRAVGESFTLGTGEGLVGDDLWAFGWGGLRSRLRRGLLLGPRRRLCVAVVLRLCETVGDRSVVHGGSSVSVVRVGSGVHGRRRWCWVMFKLHRLLSHFTVTGPSVREPEQHNRKLLITHCSTARQRGLSSAAQSNNTVWQQRPCSSLQQPL